MSHHQIRRCLRAAVPELRVRGLKQSAMFMAEQLAGLAPDDAVPPPPEAVPGAAASGPSDRLLLGQSLFELGEYERAAAALRPVDSGTAPDELWVYCYSLYLAGERRKEQEIGEREESLERTQVTNQHLAALHRILEAAHTRAALDGYGLYVYGLVLKELRSSESPAAHRDAAIRVLHDAVCACPCNWSAWLDLAELCIEGGIEPDDLVPVAGTRAAEAGWRWLFDFFAAHVYVERSQCGPALEALDRLASVFPHSNHLLAQYGLAHYTERAHDRAQECFETLLKRDPHRLDQLDIYSNILYVKERRAELSHLAHNAVKNNKYRPETCCVVGNYYSLKAQHDKAVAYFQRALRLDRKFLCAWTLMGHEFIEMKNTHAAIEAYRRAVDINPREYRAWYGLGQTYEILAMYFYALYYYRKAATLRPYDYRMWNALGNCYKRLGRPAEAITSFERADAAGDHEGESTIELARLFVGTDDVRAAHFFERHLEGQTTEVVERPETAEALLFLAHFHKSRKSLDVAARCCSRLLEYHGAAKEEAQGIMRELRALTAAA